MLTLLLYANATTTLGAVRTTDVRVMTLTLLCDSLKPSSPYISWPHLISELYASSQGEPCLAAIRIKGRLIVVSQSSFIPLLKYVERREGEKELEMWEYCFNSSHAFFHVIPLFTSPYALNLFLRSLTPSESRTSFLSVSLLPFHLDFLTSCLYRSLFLTLYLSVPSLSSPKLPLWGLCVVYLLLLFDWLPFPLCHVSSSPLTEVRDNCSSMLK